MSSVSTSTEPARAFSVDKVLHLTGLTRRQLQYWDEQGFISPSVSRGAGRGHPRLYDFRDLVSLRVASELREEWGISLQQIRSMVEHLRKLDYGHPFSEVEFFGRRGELYCREGSSVRSARRPGQSLLTFTIPFEPLVHSLEAAIEELDRRPLGGIERRRGTLGSKPVITGTRIPVATVRRMAAAGLTGAAMRKHYPELTAKDISAALAEGELASAPRKRAG